MTRARGLFSNGLLALFSVLLTLAVAELAIARLAPVPHSRERSMIFVEDDVLGYRLRPGGVGSFGDVEAVANSRGHRDEEISVPKPPGTLRILALGDSFTVGASVAQEQAYPEVLETLLAGALGSRVEVVNAGVGGWSPYQYEGYYESHGAGFEPDLVTVGFFVGNDAYSQIRELADTKTVVFGRRVSRKAAASPLIGLRVLLSVHSHLGRLLVHDARPAKGSVQRESCSDFSEFFLEVERRRLANHRRRTPRLVSRARNAVDRIAGLDRAAAMRGADVLVVLIPDEIQINPAVRRALGAEGDDALDLAMPQSMLQEMFREAGVATLDLLPAFRDAGRCLYLNDAHWNPDGHRLAAERMAAAVLEWLADAPPPKRDHSDPMVSMIR